MPEIMAMAWLNVTRAGCDCLSVGAVAMMTALDTSDVKKRAPPVASCPAPTASPTTAQHDPPALRIRTDPIRHSPSGPPLDFKNAWFCWLGTGFSARAGSCVAQPHRERVVVGKEG